VTEVVGDFPTRLGGRSGEACSSARRISCAGCHAVFCVGMGIPTGRFDLCLLRRLCNAIVGRPFQADVACRVSLSLGQLGQPGKADLQMRCKALLRRSARQVGTRKTWICYGGCRVSGLPFGMCRIRWQAPSEAARPFSFASDNSGGFVPWKIGAQALGRLANSILNDREVQLWKA